MGRKRAIDPPGRGLSFEVFHFEGHVGGDGAFLVEQCVCQSGFGNGADFPGDAEADLMDGPEGLVVEERFPGAGQLEVMGHIALGFLRLEAGQMATDGNPLLEGLHDGKIHDSSQIGLTEEDEDKGAIGIHFKVGQEPELIW